MLSFNSLFRDHSPEKRKKNSKCYNTFNSLFRDHRNIGRRRFPLLRGAIILSILSFEITWAEYEGLEYRRPSCFQFSLSRSRGGLRGNGPWNRGNFQFSLSRSREKTAEDLAWEHEGLSILSFEITASTKQCRSRISGILSILSFEITRSWGKFTDSLLKNTFQFSLSRSLVKRVADGVNTVNLSILSFEITAAASIWHSWGGYAAFNSLFRDHITLLISAFILLWLLTFNSLFRDHRTPRRNTEPPSSP